MKQSGVRSRLTERQICDIRAEVWAARMYRRAHSAKAIAARYRISEDHVRYLAAGGGGKKCREE